MSLTEKMVRLAVGALLIGLILLLFRFTGLSYAAIGTLFVAVAFGILAGICLAPLVSGPLSELAGTLFYPDVRRKVHEQYTAIHSLLAQGQFAEAETQLREALRKVPDAIDGWVLLAELLHTHLHRSEDALRAALDALAARRKWESDSERLVMLAVDICLDQGDTPRAKAILAEYARKAGRSGAATRMTERLLHLP